MNICSFVPGATEVIAALGLADRLVGISHECDFPSSVRHAPILIEPTIGHGTPSSEEIDQEVKALVAAGRPLYHLDEQAFLDAQPDLILTQDLCDVCAVTPDHLARAIHLLPSPPRVVTLNPTTLEDMIRDVERIAQAAERLSEGQELARKLRSRLDAVLARNPSEQDRVRVACLEWLDPLYAAGHWVPEMVRLAGGLDVLGKNGSRSRETTWEEVAAAQPDILIVMPCGYSIERTMQELARPGQTQKEWARALDGWPNTYIVEAASYFSRPGPRLVDGVELLASIIHPNPATTLDSTKAQPLTSTKFTMEAGS